MGKVGEGDCRGSHRVIARVTRSNPEHIVAGAAGQRGAQLVGRAAIVGMDDQSVVAAIALEDIHPAAAIQRVGAIAAVEGVGADIALDQIGAKITRSAAAQRACELNHINAAGEAGGERTRGIHRVKARVITDRNIVAAHVVHIVTGITHQEVSAQAVQDVVAVAAK